MPALDTKHTFTVTVGGNDVSAYVQEETFRVQASHSFQINSCNFTLRDTDGNLPSISAWSAVSVVDEAQNTVFAGYVTRPKEFVAIDDGTLMVTCYCQDKTVLLKTVIVRGNYTDQTDEITLDQLFATYMPEITTTNVNSSGTDSFRFDDVTLFEAVKMIAERSGYSWYVDYGGDLHYWDGTGTAAPYTLVPHGSADYATSFPWVENSISLEYDEEDMANKIIVRGGVGPSTEQTDQFNGDGATAEFFLTYAPVRKINSITVDGVHQDWDTDFAWDDFARGNECLVSYHRGRVRWDGGSAPGVGVNNVVVKYTYDAVVDVNRWNSVSLEARRRDVKYDESNANSSFSSGNVADASAEIVITDTDTDLEAAYETTSGDSAYWVRAIDNSSNVVYGFIGDITVAGNNYTLPVYDTPDRAAKNWLPAATGGFNFADTPVLYSIYRSTWVEKVIVDRDVSTVTEAQALGDAHLARYATGSVHGKVSSRRYGLLPGQVLTITCAPLGLTTATYLIQAVRTTIKAGWVTHTIDFGHHQPGIGDMFRAAAQGTLSDGGMPGGGGRGGTVAMPRSLGDRSDIEGFETSNTGDVMLGLGVATSRTTSYQNTLIGTRAGHSMTSGSENVFVGFECGYGNTDGYRNVAVGSEAYKLVTTGTDNVFIGYWAGNTATAGGDTSENTVVGAYAGSNLSSGSDHVFVGLNAGRDNTTAHFNVFVGVEAGESTTTGGYNTYIGGECGEFNETGVENAYLGYLAGQCSGNESYCVKVGAYAGTALYGDYNVCVGHTAGGGGSTGVGNALVGYQAGMEVDGGDYNVVMGYQAGLGVNANNYDNNVLLGCQSGFSLTTGSSNVFIGYQSGYNETTGSNKLYIENSNSATPLIYGEFDNDFVTINGDLRIANQNELRFYDNGNYVGFEAGALAADQIWILPLVDGGANEVIITDGAGTLSWSGAGAVATHAILDGSVHTDSVAQGVTRGSIIYANDTPKWDELELGAAGAHLESDGADIAWVVNLTMAAAATISCDIYNSVTGGNQLLKDPNEAGTIIVGSGGGAIAGGTYNTLVGLPAGNALTSGDYNTFVGYQAGNAFTDRHGAVAIGALAGASEASANYGVFVGYEAGTTADGSTGTVAIGYQAMYRNPNGDYNTAVGHQAGQGGVGGVWNNSTIIGALAGYSLTTASWIVAVGNEAARLETATDGGTYVGYQAGRDANGAAGTVAVGYRAMYENVTGDNNTIVGYEAGLGAAGNSYAGNSFFGHQAGYSAETNSNMVAVGDSAAYSEATSNSGVYVGAGAGQDANGADNTVAIGYLAMAENVTGNSNTVVGYQAGKGVAGNSYTLNTLVGYRAGYVLTTGGTNSVLGCLAFDAATTGNNAVAIGYRAGTSVVGDAGGVYIGSDAAQDAAGAAGTVAIGRSAMAENVTGNNNTIVGYQAGKGVAANSYAANTYLGYRAGYVTTTGGSNICIGERAGDNLTTGSTNIIIGANVDAAAAAGSNQLNIGNAITGDLATGNFTFDGGLTINEDSNDADTRIEGNTEDHLFTVDAGTDTVRMGDWDTNYVSVDKLGDVNFVGGGGLQFGEIWYHGAGFATACADAGAFYQVAGFDADGEANGDVAPDHTNDHITITKAGRYLISFSVSCRSAQADEYEFMVCYNDGPINGTACQNIMAHRDTSVAAALGVVACTGICDLPASATVELWVSNVDTGGRNVDIEHVTLNVVQLGGTT